MTNEPWPREQFNAVGAFIARCHPNYTLDQVREVTLAGLKWAYEGCDNLNLDHSDERPDTGANGRGSSCIAPRPGDG
jgi:hypothetical protein